MGEEVRNTLKKHLGNIVREAENIFIEMGELPKKNGTIHKSLKPRSGQYIVGSEQGIHSSYTSEDGTKYDITISKR